MYFAAKEGSSAYIHSVPWEELNLCKCFDTESTKILSAFIFSFRHETYTRLSKTSVKIHAFEFFLAQNKVWHFLRLEIWIFAVYVPLEFIHTFPVVK